MLEGLWVASNACCRVHRSSAQKSVATILVTYWEETPGDLESHARTF